MCVSMSIYAIFITIFKHIFFKNFKLNYCDIKHNY